MLDKAGRRLKDLPAPGVRDDQELAPAERKRLGALKKEVRAIADVEDAGFDLPDDATVRLPDPLLLGELDPVVASELLADREAVTAP
ncbi:hypothetical protein AB0C76_29215 [Kitasatospora sp. NPDC048722]|uniref:hypothetical protein n=1 Tax=Kitasatospora sp. NPDC048722 TaxID=3155639 RepID=UPI0033DB2DDB